MNLSPCGLFASVDAGDPISVFAVFSKSMNVASSVLSWAVMFSLYL